LILTVETYPVDPQFEEADWKFNVLSAAFSVRSKFRVRSGR